MRDETFKTVRDNVVFELGLSMGILGIEKVILLAPYGEEGLHLPTDLLGLTVGKYNGNRTDGNLRAATNPFCLEVRQKIKEKN